MDPEDVPIFNMVKILHAHLEYLTDERRETIERFFADPEGVETELMGRVADEIGLRIEERVFWFPVLWLTQPTTDPGEN